MENVPEMAAETLSIKRCFHFTSKFQNLFVPTIFYSNFSYMTLNDHEPACIYLIHKFYCKTGQKNVF